MLRTALSPTMELAAIFSAITSGASLVFSLRGLNDPQNQDQDSRSKKC